MALLQDLVGDLLLALDVDEAEAVGDLAADEEVAPERLLLGERLVLVDGLDRQVVRHAHRIVGEVDLLVADEDAPRGRREHAGHHLDQGGLAGAVVADQADDLVPADGEIDVAQRLDRAEEFLHALQPHDVPVVRLWRGSTKLIFAASSGIQRSVRPIRLLALRCDHGRISPIKFGVACHSR